MRRGRARLAGALLFVALTAANCRLSWRYFAGPRSHGYHRFFAFQAIAGLVGLNLPCWFDKPLSLRQILSWPLLLASAGLAAHGFYLLRRAGTPGVGGENTEGLIRGFEDTSRLVRTGAYRYIRHPLYASLLCLAWGAFLKNPSRRATALAATASVSLFRTARVEEDENRRRFGAEYDAYARQTRMFIPGLL